MHKRILLAILVGMLIPIPQTVVPPWSAHVVDESGAPQAGAIVQQVWQQYSLESGAHQEDRRTDAKGMVAFPRRTLWRPPIANLIGIIHNRMKDGPNALFGPVAYLVATHGDTQSFSDKCENCKMVLHPVPKVVPIPEATQNPEGKKPEVKK